MKKYIKHWLYIFICSLLLIWFTFWYQEQWFSKYEEKSGWINFNCTSQCIITLWQKDKIDYLNLDWIVNWNGIVGYGFLVWNQMTLLNQYNVTLKSSINESVNFIDLKQYLSSVPWDTDLVLLFNGSINWDIKVDAGKLSFGKKISQCWKDFWNMETFTPYSINLRYWVSLMWTSIVKVGYILFIILSILILIFKKWKKEQKFKVIFYVWLWLFLFIWIRNLITYTSILNQWLKWFKENKTYFGLWDYIEFTSEIRKELNLDSKEISKDDCKVYINSFQDRPFSAHRESFYLKPCERVLTWNLADYKIYYKTEIPSGDLDKTVLVNFNNSYLLENNSK
jgi:hypothetical protein